MVDDDRQLSEMLGMVLQGEGFLTEHAADGTEAVDLFQKVRPDLVLLDLMLPGIDGIEVCSQIRAESGVPIIRGCQMVCVRGVGFLRKDDTDDHDRQGSPRAAAA